MHLHYTPSPYAKFMDNKKIIGVINLSKIFFILINHSRNYIDIIKTNKN